MGTSLSQIGQRLHHLHRLQAHRDDLADEADDVFGVVGAIGMDFLLTWNCRHIHNAFIEHRLQGVCEALGLWLPTLCTPTELMADYLQS